MATAGISHWADILVIVLYFVLLLSVGFWTLWRPNRGNVKNYFLAGSSMTWFPVGASLFASNIGAEHFVGLAGTGAAGGISIILYEWLPSMLVIALGWFFLPVYISAGVFTLPEYLEKRFGGKRIRTYISILSLIMYIIIKLSVSIFSGAIYIQLALSWNMYASIVGLLVVAAIYTMLGGLAAVMYTDAVQTVIMMIGAFFVCGYGFHAIGGYKQLEVKYFNAIATVHDPNSTCGLPRDDAFHLFRDPVHSDNPWPGLVLQATIGCVWYWCCDQVIVQRALAAKNLSHAKGGSVMAAFLKILPMFVMVLPGMISRALYPDEVGCSDPDECNKVCDNPIGCSNIAYPKLVLELLPVGLRGLLMAAMISAVVSSLTSIFNSASSVFTMDLWTRLRPLASQRELLIIGRLAVVAMCILSILWLPMVKTAQGGQIFLYLNAVQACLGTPVGAVFIWAILWRRTTERAAFYALIVSQIAGLVRVVLEFVYPQPACGEVDTRPAVLYKVHYTYFGPLTMVIASIVIVAVTLLFKDDPHTNLEGTTWWTRHRGLTRDEKTAAFEQEIVELDRIEHTNDELHQAISQTPDKEDDVSRYRRVVHFICGMPKGGETANRVAMTVAEVRRFLTEKPSTKMVLNIAAVLQVVAVFFLLGFYH